MKKEVVKYNNSVFFQFTYEDVYKRQAKSAYIEAAINIILSVAFVIKFGLVGIAVGTLVGMSYRMLYFVWYISHNILKRSVTKFIKRLGISSLILVLSPLLVSVLDTTGSTSVLLWIKNGVICLFTYGDVYKRQRYMIKLAVMRE